MKSILDRSNAPNVGPQRKRVADAVSLMFLPELGQLPQ
jgi:hypothetical protein